MSDLTCTEYSEKAIVVRGESTKKYIDQLTQLGGKYNDHLRGGAGWIFSKKSEVKVKQFIASRGNEKVKNKDDDNLIESDNFSDLLNEIKERFDSVDLSYRLKFISEVATLLSKPLKPLKTVKPVKPLESAVKVVYKQQANIVDEDEYEEEDSDEVKSTPHKRLL